MEAPSDIPIFVKITYRGAMRYVICDMGSGYADIIKLAMVQFGIPEAYERGLTLTNGRGYSFNKELFEYFILLFPQPEIVFHLRLDFNVTITSISKTPTVARVPFGKSTCTNKRTHNQIDETADELNYQAAPVRRQNCFIGALPTNSAAIDRQQEVEFSRQMTKRMRVAMPVAKKPKRPKTFNNRTLRL